MSFCVEWTLETLYEAQRRKCGLQRGSFNFAHKAFFRCYFPLKNALCSNFPRIKHPPGKGFKRFEPCLLNEVQQSGKYPVLPAQENYDFHDLMVKGNSII